MDNILELGLYEELQPEENIHISVKAVHEPLKTQNIDIYKGPDDLHENKLKNLSEIISRRTDRDI